MKKKTKKLVLAKETVRSLEDLARVMGGMTEECSGQRWGCEDTAASRNADC
jgi:hypothetical protein